MRSRRRDPHPHPHPNPNPNPSPNPYPNPNPNPYPNPNPNPYPNPNPNQAVEHALRLASGLPIRALDTGAELRLRADSICVHGDKPSAVAQARGVRDALLAEGFTLCTLPEVVFFQGQYFAEVVWWSSGSMNTLDEKHRTPGCTTSSRRPRVGASWRHSLGTVLICTLPTTERGLPQTYPLF